MKDKNKKLLIYGGAAAGVLFIITRGGGAGGFGGGFGGAPYGEGSGLTGGGMLETAQAAVADVVPFIGAPDIESKKASDYTEAQYGSAAGEGEYIHSLFYGDPNAQRRADAQYDRDYPAKKESMTEKVKSDVKLPGVTGAGFWDMIFGASDITRFVKAKAPSMKKVSTPYKGSTPIRYSGSMTSIVAAVKPKSSSGGSGTYPSKKASDYSSGQYGSAAGEGQKAHNLFGGY